MNEPMDTTDEKALKDRRKQDAIAKKQADLDLYEVMKSDVGRRVIWDLLGLHGPYLSSYSNNALDMAFNEGQRNFAVRTTELLLRVCPDLYLKAQAEAVNRKATR